MFTYSLHIALFLLYRLFVKVQQREYKANIHGTFMLLLLEIYKYNISCRQTWTMAQAFICLVMACNVG